MHPTRHARANELIGELVRGLRDSLRDDLVALYLHGSVVGEDFDEAVSDLDLLAVVSSPVDDPALARLAATHAAVVGRHPDWDDRIEVLCIDVEALARFGDGTSEVVRVSPGEPLHRTIASPHWILDLHAARERAVTLVGPPPPTLLPSLSRAELVRALRTNLRQWRDWSAEATTRAEHAYAVLTVCRNLCACSSSALVSKAEGARWAASAYPEWAGLIADALAWRRARSGVEDTDAGARVARFVEFAVARAEDLE